MYQTFHGQLEHLRVRVMERIEHAQYLRRQVLSSLDAMLTV